MGGSTDIQIQKTYEVLTLPERTHRFGGIGFLTGRILNEATHRPNEQSQSIGRKIEMKLSICRRHSLLCVQSVAIAVLFSSASAFAQTSLPASAVISQGESEKIDAYLRSYNSGVVVTKTAVDRFGQLLSCVDIQHQPAVNSPAMKGREVQSQPSAELKAILGSVKEDDTLSLCPKGSVGMILPTREQIVRAGSVNKFTRSEEHTSELQSQR